MYSRETAGRAARTNGEYFERLIGNACDRYAELRIARIKKTPEPMRPIKKPNRLGQFLACYTKSAQPDFKGTLKGGRAIMFEAKHTATGRIKQDRVTPEQMQELLEYRKLGAVCFVLVSFEFKSFYRVPIEVWVQMKEFFGKVSVNEADIAGYKLPGIWNFLDATANGEKL